MELPDGSMAEWQNRRLTSFSAIRQLPSAIMFLDTDVLPSRPTCFLSADGIQRDCCVFGSGEYAARFQPQVQWAFAPVSKAGGAMARGDQQPRGAADVE